jgi:hypothetical protein
MAVAPRTVMVRARAASTALIYPIKGVDADLRRHDGEASPESRLQRGLVLERFPFALARGTRSNALNASVYRLGDSTCPDNALAAGTVAAADVLAALGGLGVVVRALVMGRVRGARDKRVCRRGDSGGQADSRCGGKDHGLHLGSPSRAGRTVRLVWRHDARLALRVASPGHKFEFTIAPTPGSQIM